MPTVLSRKAGGGSGGGAPSGPAGGELAGTYPNPTVDLTYVEAALAADVAMANADQYYDGPAVTLSAGTWLLVGCVTYDGANTSSEVSAKLWDGTTVEASSQAISYAGAAIRVRASITLTGVVVIAVGTPTWKISVAASDGVDTIIRAATPDNASGNNASRLVAVKIG